VAKYFKGMPCESDLTCWVIRRKCSAVPRVLLRLERSFASVTWPSHKWNGRSDIAEQVSREELEAPKKIIMLFLLCNSSRKTWRRERSSKPSEAWYF